MDHIFSLFSFPFGVFVDVVLNLTNTHLSLGSTPGFFADWASDWRTKSGCFMGLGFGLLAWISVLCVQDWQSRAPLRETQKAKLAQSTGAQ